MFDTIKTYYIAGPITTSTQPDNNRAAFEAAEAELELSFNVINPWRNFGGGRDDALTPPASTYMRMSFHQLLCAHAIYMLPGWTRSDNCKAELAVAQCLGLEVTYHPDAER